MSASRPSLSASHAARFLTSALLLVSTGAIHGQTLVFDPDEPIAATAAYPLNDRPRVRFTEDGTSHVVWSMGTWAREGAFVVSAPPGGGYGDATMLSPEMSGVYTVVGAGPTLRVKGDRMAAGWEDRNDANRGIYAALSTDGGQTWAPALRADPQTPANRLFQALGLFPDGRMAQAWIGPDTLSAPGIVWTVQDSQGVFRDPMEASAVAPFEACDCCYPDQIVLGDGRTVLVAFRNNEENLREIHVVRSEDGGRTFPLDRRVDTTGWVLGACPSTGPGLAASGDTVVVCWRSGAGGLNHVWMARSLDGGSTFEPMRKVDTSQGTGMRNYPQAAIRGRLAVIVWEENGTDNGQVVMASESRDAGATWDEPVIVSDDDVSMKTQASVAIAPDREIEVVWKDLRLGANRIFRSRGWDGLLGVPAGRGGAHPRAFTLAQNRPNPFNPSTTIDYTLPADAPATAISLEIFDLRGRRVRTLLRDDRPVPGTHSVSWDGRDGRGEEVASGVYLYRIRRGHDLETRRMLLAK